MQKEKLMLRKSKIEGKSKSERKDKLAIFLLGLIVLAFLSVFTVKQVSSYLAEKHYQEFIKTEIFTDENGVNILGSYVPTGQGLIHSIVKQENSLTDKDYVLYVVVEKDNSKLPVMRITHEQSEHLNRYLCTATTLDLNGVVQENLEQLDSQEEVPEQ